MEAGEMSDEDDCITELYKLRLGVMIFFAMPILGNQCLVVQRGLDTCEGVAKRYSKRSIGQIC